MHTIQIKVFSHKVKSSAVSSSIRFFWSHARSNINCNKPKCSVKAKNIKNEPRKFYKLYKLSHSTGNPKPWWLFSTLHGIPQYEPCFKVQYSCFQKVNLLLQTLSFHSFWKLDNSSLIFARMWESEDTHGLKMSSCFRETPFLCS